MNLHLSALGSVVLAAGLFGTVAAREEVRPLPATRAAAIESCAGGPPIRFQPTDRRVVLDSADAAAVGALLLRRYPVLGRDGLGPDDIVLWRGPGTGWLYVTLLSNPLKPTEACFTATFTAARLEITAGLIGKYFGPGVGDD